MKYCRFINDYKYKIYNSFEENNTLIAEEISGWGLFQEQKFLKSFLKIFLI